MSEATQSLKGPEISRQIFGGVLTYDAAGYYPGLELLNFVFGTGDVLLPNSEGVRVTKASHDFARRLVWDPEFHNHPERGNVFVDEGQAEDTLRRLLECLQLDIPNSKATPSWSRAHFFPYTKSLIHWDARSRTKKNTDQVIIERKYLRGGGALAFKVLRTDPNEQRLQQIRTGFTNLYPTKETALNRLASVLAEHGKQEADSILDQIELKSQTFNDQIDETFRDGIARILGHADLPAVSRIRAVMNWTGFWLILAEMNRAAKSLGKHAPIILCDCGSTHAQLRRSSQRSLKQILGLIETAVQSHADSHSADIPKRHLQNIRGFFWATAATIKLLNAWNGRKHFTLGLDILEALVLAGCESGSEMPYDVFLDQWIYGRCGIVIGRNAAEESDLLATLDSSIFEDNENELATQMTAAGLLTQYSDATRMVSTGGLK